MAEKKEKSGKKGMGAAFYITVTVLIVVPVVALLGWYVLTASEATKSAEMLLAKAQEAMERKITERADAEGFQVEEFDKCTQIQDHFKTPLGYGFTDASRRKLLGLSGHATEEDEQERCVVLAKVVTSMEKTTHHDRHVFVCQGAEFSVDDGAYKLLADPDGRGVIEVDTDVEKLIPIKKHKFILLESWQVYNLGDGCLVIGMSKSGKFWYSGSVNITN